MKYIKNNSTVVFIGDSVTDCGRNRNDLSDLGPSYVKKIADYFAAFHADMGVRFINAGISGNRVRDLQHRWQKDCLDFKPDVVNILIGINDCWRRYDSNDPTSAESFESTYEDILSKAAAAGAKLILMEPFVLPYADKLAWREDLDPKIQAVRRLARRFGAELITLDSLFAKLIIKAPMERFSADGVHPTDAGHAVIAKAWLDAVGA